MRCIPALGDEPEVRTDGAHRGRDVRIGNPEIVLHSYANDSVVAGYRYEHRDVLVNFVGRLKLELSWLPVDLRAQDMSSEAERRQKFKLNCADRRAA